MQIRPLYTRVLIAFFALSALTPGLALADDEGPKNKGIDIDHHVGVMRELRADIKGLRASLIPRTSIQGDLSRPVNNNDDDRDVGRSVQVNNAADDRIETFPGRRPYEFSIESETSHASFGKNIVVGYNSSAGAITRRNPDGTFGGFEVIRFSAFSSSQDGGKTWRASFLEGLPGTFHTFGDPSVGVDRTGRFYYASFGVTPADVDAVIVNTSDNGGRTFSPGRLVAEDAGSDKEWLAVGPDPADRDRDNVYIAWTSFQFTPGVGFTGSQLRFSRSTDRGATWSAQEILFAPEDEGPDGMSSFIQFANPVVDHKTGRLYIPFLHFSNFDADFVKVLVSDDGGLTFRFLRFDVAGAPDPFGFPNVTPGALADCGSPGGGFRIVLRVGNDLGGGRFGLPRWRHATRLLTQPTAAAADGRLFIAINSSTSATVGDPDSRSEIRLLFSPNGGESWARPVTAARATGDEPQHVNPSIAADSRGRSVHVAYYVQQRNGQLRVDERSGRVEGGRVRFGEEARQLSPAFDLIPSNNPIPDVEEPGQPKMPNRTTNYDRLVVPCYNIGEYLHITSVEKRGSFVSWGDNRNGWTSPADSPAAGPHSQPDVFVTRAD